MVHETDVYVVH